uniref:VWFA domain-containing protein n=1 Tax=Panagrolaimus sp. PS1159 TaxID=55785 RepID=A0AC35FCN6_9BILA
EKPEVSPPKKESSSGNDKKEVIKNKDCRYDIVFVIDASGSLRKRYQHQLEIASKLIDKFNFEKSQIGVIRYSGRKRSKVAISLGSKHTKEEFNAEFLHMPFMGGTTYTDEALDKAFEEITGPNIRADALPLVIVFTDGFSQPDPTESAKKIHAKSIPTFAIGITDGQIVNENELKSIASTPKNVFLDSNINELEQLFVKLSENC